MERRDTTQPCEFFGRRFRHDVRGSAQPGIFHFQPRKGTRLRPYTFLRMPRSGADGKRLGVRARWLRACQFYRVHGWQRRHEHEIRRKERRFVRASDTPWREIRASCNMRGLYELPPGARNRLVRSIDVRHFVLPPAFAHVSRACTQRIL